MKGIVFTELIEMVEVDLGLEIADRMIEGAKLPGGGAYTAVGTYDYHELIELVVSLSEAANAPVPDLVQAFGRHLFSRFQILYPQFFEGVDSALEFLPRIETCIHVEVRKLYPEAELPTFECDQSDGTLELTYRSTRPFADLAEGLIRACVEHFRDAVDVQRFDFGEQDGTTAKFTLTPVAVTVASETAS